MNSWHIVSQVRRRMEEEQGALHRQAPFRIALCYPSEYAVGMSSLGFQTIYREINLHSGAVAERAFLPDKPGDYRRLHLSVFTYENQTPLAEFPIVAFSISYELEITGLLETLDLSGIPLLRAERSRRHPLIVAGGPLTYSNPLPLAPFADVIVLGEADELVHELLDAAAAMERDALLQHLANRPGYFIPALAGAPGAIARALEDRLPAYSQILTQNTVLDSMFLIEPERGCSRSCTYCVMRRTTHGGMRPAPREKVLSLIPDYARRVGLVGAAVTDHPDIRPILRSIVDAGREVGISSLRADRLDEELVELLARGGCRTLTTASDGPSQRLRDFLERRTEEQHLIRAAELVRNFNLERLKLYEMIGLPGETQEDIEELARFARELAQIAPLSLAIAPFVAKRNTPLDRAPFEPIASLNAKLAYLRSQIGDKVEIRWGSTRWAWVEFMLSQGDVNSGLAALEAWRAGGSFSAWKRAFAGDTIPSSWARTSNA